MDNESETNECPNRWTGPGPHLWSVPREHGWQSCLFCGERRKCEIVEQPRERHHPDDWNN